MADIVSEYLSALERLKNGATVRVPPGTGISKDSVALEAGRGRGAIKRSRAIFSDLIAAIELEASSQEPPTDNLELKLQISKKEAARYRKMYEESLSRELSLVHQIDRLRRALKHEK